MDKLSKILVASDLSQRSEQAAARAFRLAEVHGADVRLVHVVDDALPAAVAREVKQAVKSHLTTAIAGHERIPADRVSIDLRMGSVWKTILAAADDFDAGLIVLGAHRARGLAELFRGTVLERVARRAEVPVLMVHDAPETAYNRVVVGIDFSPASRKAVSAAVAMAPEAELTLLSTYHMFFREFIDRAEPGDSDIVAERKRLERDLAAQMAEFIKTCPERAKGYRTAYREGGAAMGLMTYAKSEKADMIAIGSHGRSWISTPILGGTARDLLAGAPCDVLVTRP